MKVKVDLPDPLEVTETIRLMVGPGMHLVVIDAKGIITISQNGGGGVSFTMNPEEIFKEIKNRVRS